MSVALSNQPAAPPEGVTTASVLIPLSDLVRSKTNPRKSFDGPELDELTESIRQHGILQPILVRPIHHDCMSGEPIPADSRPDAFEIVCGERRYRAATRVGDGLSEIPAIIRNLTDEQVLEIQIVENLQRKDVTPLEEADGFRQLLAALQNEQPTVGQKELVQTIAQKIGKSVRYVYARLALDKLIPEIKDLIGKGTLTASHGDLLAPFDEKKQREIYVDRFCDYSDEKTDAYIDMAEREDEGEAIPENERIPLAELAVRPAEKMPSVRDLKDSLVGQGEDLKKAAWKWNKEMGDETSDPPLCLGCQFNSASVEGSDQKRPRCMNSECFARKMKYFITIELDHLKSKTGKTEIRVTGGSSTPKGAVAKDNWKKAKLGSCEFVLPALLVDYPGEWLNALSVCTNKKCKVHFGAAASSRPESAADKKEKEEQAKRDAARKRENSVRRQLFGALIAGIGAVTPDLLRTFVSSVINKWQLEVLEKWLPDAAVALKKAKTDSADFAKVLVTYVLHQGIEVESYQSPDPDQKRFHEDLASFGLEWKSMRAKFEAEYDAKLAPKSEQKKQLTPEQLAALPIAPGSTSKKKTASKSTTKKAAKPAKKSAKKGGRK